MKPLLPNQTRCIHPSPGATLVRQLEAPGPGGIPEPCCDLLLLDEEEGTAGAAGGEVARAAKDLQRLARRLRIPVHERNWAIQVGRAGCLMVVCV